MAHSMNDMLVSFRSMLVTDRNKGQNNLDKKQKIENSLKRTKENAL